MKGKIQVTAAAGVQPLPCPNCGAGEVSADVKALHDPAHGWACECYLCGVRGPWAKTKALAAAAWNEFGRKVAGGGR